MKNNFVALILTHGRADRVDTYNTLRKHGYTGDICLVVDDEDDQYDAYVKKYGSQVVQFHKAGVECDAVDNRQERRVILYARNAAFDVAKQLGKDYFIELDDDYTSFTFRFDKDGEFKEHPTKSLDQIFDLMCDFLQTDERIVTIAMAQGGDFIGGGEGRYGRSIFLGRKAMNTFVCKTDRRFAFLGRINEDVNTYTLEGSRGKIFCSHNLICVHQKQTQSNAGGMTGAYIDGGTYIKSFYSVICQPSSVKISMLHSSNSRIHHSIDWRHTVPKILRERDSQK